MSNNNKLLSKCFVLFKKLLVILFSTILLLVIIVYIIGGGFGDLSNRDKLNNGEPLIFAHRGVMNYCIQNSLESFDSSRNLGFNAIETDVTFTSDNKLIIFHDDSCQSLLGIDSCINDLSWRSLENKFLLQGGNPTKNKVLSLEQFFQKIDTSIFAYIDVKDVNKKVADSLVYLIEKYHNFNNVVVADANIFFLSYIKVKNPNIKVAIEGFNNGKEWIYYFLPKNFKPDYYAGSISLINQEHIGFFKNKGILDRKIAYVVNKTNLSQAKKFGIQNIIVDYDSVMGKVEEMKIRLRTQK